MYIYRFFSFSTDSPLLNQSYTTSTNVLKVGEILNRKKYYIIQMVFAANDTAPIGTGWEVEYSGVFWLFFYFKQFNARHRKTIYAIK